MYSLYVISMTGLHIKHLDTCFVLLVVVIHCGYNCISNLFYGLFHKAIY